MAVVIKLKYSDEVFKAQGQAEKNDQTNRLVCTAPDGKVTGEFQLDKVEHCITRHKTHASQRANSHLCRRP